MILINFKSFLKLDMVSCFRITRMIFEKTTWLLDLHSTSTALALLPNNILTSFISNPNLMYFSGRHVNACTRAEGLFLVTIFWIRDGEGSSTNQMSRYTAVRVRRVVRVSGIESYEQGKKNQFTLIS